MGYSDLRKGWHSEPNREYLITTVTYQRIPLFDDFQLARLFINILRQSEEKHECQWLCWVLMPDHFHGLLRLSEESTVGRASVRQNHLSTTMQAVKGASAQEINKYREKTGPVWQAAFHDHALRKEEDQLKTARYIVANPLRAGLVDKLGDWPHWDSVWLSG